MRSTLSGITHIVLFLSPSKAITPKFGEYEKGFEPDILMDETNPYNEQGVFYIHKDYGNNEEPLYAKAIELITGTNPAPQTRSAVVNTLDGKTYKLPAIFRPGHDGMLMPARHAE